MDEDQEAWERTIAQNRRAYSYCLVFAIPLLIVLGVLAFAFFAYAAAH